MATEIRVYQVPEGERRAGLFTFTVDGQPSLWYSTSETSVYKKIASLKGVHQPAAVRLPALGAKAAALGDQAGGPPAPPAPETMEQFMRRGKLAKKEAEA